MRFDRCVGRSAYILAETEQTLIGKVSLKYMTPQGVKYHATCLADLCRRGNRFQKEHVAFGKVISFIEEYWLRSCEEKEVIFKLSELIKIYNRWLQKLNVKITSMVYIARLKEKIHCQFNYKRAYTKRQEVYLTHDKAVKEALKASSNIQ